MQHIAVSNLKITDYFSRNLVGGATPDENYEEEYVIYIITEHVELNLKRGTLFTHQSKHNKSKTELRDDDTETQDQRNENQSQAKRTFENKNSLNEIEQSKPTTSGSVQNQHFKIKSHLVSTKSKQTNGRENFHHWGATREIVDIIRRRNNSPETRRLIEQRNALSRPVTLRRRYDHQTQRTVFALSRPNKRSREVIAEIDAETMRRANRLGGGYEQMQEEPEGIPEEGEINQEPEDTEENSVVLRGENLPIVDLSKYNTDGKEAKYIQINHIVGKLTSEKKSLKKT